MTNIIKVRFLKDGQPHGKEYSYLTPTEVEVGNIVETETRGKKAKGIVTQIDVPEKEVKAFKDKLKSIIGKVDREECSEPGQAETPDVEEKGDKDENGICCSSDIRCNINKDSTQSSNTGKRI